MRLLVVLILLLCSGCIFIPTTSSKVQKPKNSSYEEVDLEEMIRRHIAKTPEAGVEGIYTVSCVITKKGRTILSPEEKLRTILRKDNYARVAIVKDWPGSNNEYVEIALKEKGAARYPIVAELSGLAEGGGFIYTHFEPKGKKMSFTFLYDKAKPDILEGVYTEHERNNEITYKLTYVKVYPKSNDLQTER